MEELFWIGRGRRKLKSKSNAHEAKILIWKSCRSKFYSPPWTPLTKSLSCITILQPRDFTDITLNIDENHRFREKTGIAWQSVSVSERYTQLYINVLLNIIVNLEPCCSKGQDLKKDQNTSCWAFRVVIDILVSFLELFCSNLCRYNL